MGAAALFLIFNRPDTTARVFEAIRQARPPRLYVAADGPRPDCQGEKERCEASRQIGTSVDWPCEVRTLFRGENLGCRVAISTAIDWFFEQEESGVILEDDCVPSHGFFRYAEELLARYRHDERIMTVSAQHFHRDVHTPKHSYFFSRYNHCWGWASWRRAWRHYDRDMSLWPELRGTDWLLSIGDGSRLFQHYWTRIFDVAYECQQVDSWAYRWTFSCWAQSGLAILPAVNLVANIGFGVESTHTRKANPVVDNLALESLAFPLIHPQAIVRDVVADGWTDRHVFGIRRSMRLKALIRKVPGRKIGAGVVGSFRGR